MALDPTQHARVEEINAALRAGGFDKRAGGLAERATLRNELAQIFTTDATPAPQVDEHTAGLVAQADAFSSALHSRRWSAPDHRLIGEALADVVGRMPNGVWSPPMHIPTPAASWPAGLLPAEVTHRLADAGMQGQARDEALADLHRALSSTGAGSGERGAAP